MKKRSRRNIQATFLLKCVTLAACVGLFLLSLKIFALTSVTIGAIVFLLCFWFIGIELQFLPEYLERLLERRAASSDKPISSLWFIDMDARLTAERETFQNDTDENPTLR